MTQPNDKLKNLPWIQILAILLIVVGLVIMIPKGLGMFNLYKEARYATENNFQDGNPSAELLRPWMSIRYISIAYSVPQKYLFDAAHIEPKKENSMISIKRLNSQMGLGVQNNIPTLMGILRQAILKYREAPVATGLIEHNVAEWMTVQYIANSTGIPAEMIFKEIQIPMNGNAFLPLGTLSDSLKYAGGPRALAAAIQKVVDSQTAQP